MQEPLGQTFPGGSGRPSPLELQRQHVAMNVGHAWPTSREHDTRMMPWMMTPSEVENVTSRGSCRIPCPKKSNLVAGGTEAQGTDIQTRVRDDKQWLTSWRQRQRKEHWSFPPTKPRKPQKDQLVECHSDSRKSLNSTTTNLHELPCDDSQVHVPVEADPFKVC